MMYGRSQTLMGIMQMKHRRKYFSETLIPLRNVGLSPFCHGNYGSNLYMQYGNSLKLNFLRNICANFKGPRTSADNLRTSFFAWTSPTPQVFATCPLQQPQATQPYCIQLSYQFYILIIYANSHLNHIQNVNIYYLIKCLTVCIYKATLTYISTYLFSCFLTPNNSY